MSSSNRLFIPGQSQVNTTPPPPITGYGHPRCYARSLNDCSRKISLEHYISKQALALWADSGEVITNYSVFPGQILSRLPIKILGAKILCERHNKALSGLDQVGGDFCRFIRNIPTRIKNVVINGFDLEKWMLKVFLGDSVIVQKQEKGIKNWQPPVELLNILFNSRSLGSNRGLYGFSLKNVSVPTEGVLTNYVSDKNSGEGVGILFKIEGLPLFFGIDVPPAILPNHYIQQFFHPAIIAIAEGDSVRELHTGWSDGVRLTLVN